MQQVKKGNIIKLQAEDGERFGLIVDFADAYGATDILYMNIAGSTFLDSTIIDDRQPIEVLGHISNDVIRSTVLCRNPESLN